MRYKKGTSLIEILVYCVVFLLVMGGIFSILIYSLRYYRAAEIMTTLQQNSLIALNSITEDLSDSTMKNNGLVYDSTLQGVMFASPRDSSGNYLFDNSTNEIRWQRWVCYYLEDQSDGTKNLVKKEAPQATITTAEPGTPPYSNVQNFIAAGVDKRVIARQVTTFTVTPTSNRAVIRVVVDGTTDATRPNLVDAQTEVFLRN